MGSLYCRPVRLSRLMTLTVAPEGANPIHQTRNQEVLQIAMNADPVVGLGQLEEHVLNHVLRMTAVTCQEDRHLQQIDLVPIIDLAQGIDPAPSESPDKPLVLQHGVYLLKHCGSLPYYTPKPGVCVYRQSGILRNLCGRYGVVGAETLREIAELERSQGGVFDGMAGVEEGMGGGVEMTSR